MNKLNKFDKIKGILQLLGIVVSSLLAGLSAYGVGGDPVIGASIGASINTVIAAATSALIHAS